MEMKNKMNVLIICHAPHHSPKFKNNDKYNISFFDTGISNIQQFTKNKQNFIKYDYKL